MQSKAQIKMYCQLDVVVLYKQHVDVYLLNIRPDFPSMYQCNVKK